MFSAAKLHKNMEIRKYFNKKFGDIKKNMYLCRKIIDIITKKEI